MNQSAEVIPSSTPDRVEKQIVVKAPRSRVWRALSTASEFGAWFGARLEGGTFVPGQRAYGHMTMKGMERWVLDFTVERVEPERYLAYRWHPYAEPDLDLSAEPTTLVEFRLEEVAGGTRVTVVESGFSRIQLARRAPVQKAHAEGWAMQLENVARHVAG